MHSFLHIQAKVTNWKEIEILFLIEFCFNKDFFDSTHVYFAYYISYRIFFVFLSPHMVQASYYSNFHCDAFYFLLIYFYSCFIIQLPFALPWSLRGKGQMRWIKRWQWKPISYLKWTGVGSLAITWTNDYW